MILEQTGARVRGLHQDEQAGLVLGAGAHEGFAGVFAEVGIHRQGVAGREDLAGEESLGIGRRRGTDVAAFGIHDDQQAAFLGVDLAEEEFAAVSERCTFKYMKKNAEVPAPGH